MYPPVVNSPKTELTELVTDTQTEITVADASVLLQGEGIAVLGNGDAAETITYTSVEDNVLKGCVRGFEGVARAWPVGTRIARNFTAADWRAATNNIKALYDQSSVELHKSVTLQPGVQIVKADRQAVFSLTGLTGKTVIDYDGQKGLFGVRNPYVIRYGENLLPSFYEWTVHSNAKVTNPNALSLVTAQSTQELSYYDFRAVIVGQKYTVSFQGAGKAIISFVDTTNSAPTRVIVSAATPVTFTVPNGTVYIRVYVGNLISYTDENNPSTYTYAAGTYMFSNMMFSIGETVKPFKPREDSMLALQTDLYADPVTGANADTVFERDGQYCKSKKWKGIVLDGNQAWAYKDSKVGNKQVTLPLSDQKTDSERVVKYDGKLIAHAYPWSDADQSFLAADGLYLSIPVADSGWADSYTPTQDDIKAYFFGYKAYDANTITPANAQAMTTATWTGTGTKYWVQRVGSPAFTQSTPQTSYAGYTPYQLVYQLATPTVEPIVAEGQLSFIEGDNQVEVGTGIVLREKATPFGAYINAINAAGGTSNLKNKTTRILAVYKSGMRDGSWSLRPHVFNGEDYMYAMNLDVDNGFPYTVSYITRDRSPVASFIGTYAANEKTLLLDLVDSVQQNNARLSVVENKKAEKDSPAWITPTLFNGWTPLEDQSGMGYRTAQYYKDSSNRVHVRGLIKSGVKTLGTVLFKLPQGYRPSFSETFIVAMSYTATTVTYTTRVTVLRTGDVILAVELTGGTDPYWIQLFGINYLAEQ
ncbi:hypothetical protein PPOLYM_02555 [Paenibacillus polymyxa]|uniref:hypothetical protein n=1 Tax=Paenibacillus polymyxa TaxID=1406 RepID=UPI000AF4042A|nr:hypothetical protein PPOLYM_02555 [Paenibacillus polymyxa]